MSQVKLSYYNNADNQVKIITQARDTLNKPDSLKLYPSGQT
jgi:hypothetical protein